MDKKPIKWDYKITDIMSAKKINLYYDDYADYEA